MISGSGMRPVHLGKVHCSAASCSALHCSAVQCSAVQRGAVQVIALQRSAGQCSVVQFRSVQYTVGCSLRSPPVMNSLLPDSITGLPLNVVVKFKIFILEQNLKIQLAMWTYFLKHTKLLPEKFQSPNLPYSEGIGSPESQF